MPYSTKIIVTDVNNKPVPQYYNPKTDAYEPIHGRDGANSFIEKGRIVKDVFNGSSAITKNYSTNMYGIGIVNDGIADLTFTINGINVLVKPGEMFDDLFEPFMKITINATSHFRAVVRE